MSSPGESGGPHSCCTRRKANQMRRSRLRSWRALLHHSTRPQMCVQQAIQLSTRMLCDLLGWLVILPACRGCLFSSVNVCLISVHPLLLILTLPAGWKSHMPSEMPLLYMHIPISSGTQAFLELWSTRRLSHTVLCWLHRTLHLGRNHRSSL